VKLFQRGCYHMPQLLYASDTTLSCPSLWTSIWYLQLSLLQVKFACHKGCLFRFSPYTGLLQLLAPCGDFPELLALWEEILMGRCLTVGEPLSLLDFSPAHQVGWNCQLPVLVCLTHRLTTERDEPSGETPVLQGSF
jgi:hypothetical protein